MPHFLHIKKALTLTLSGLKNHAPLPPYKKGLAYSYTHFLWPLSVCLCACPPACRPQIIRQVAAAAAVAREGFIPCYNGCLLFQAPATLYRHRGGGGLQPPVHVCHPLSLSTSFYHYHAPVAAWYYRPPTPPPSNMFKLCNNLKK